MKSLLMAFGKTWRAFGTGLCFLLYGALSLIASLTLLPLLIFWPGSAARREYRIRAFVSWSFRVLLGFIAFLGLGRVEVDGREWLNDVGGKLIVASHPMYLDVCALLGLVPQADCVVKGAMLRNPFYRRFARAAGYISNRDPDGLIETCGNALQRGRTLVLFPEGTRSTPEKPLRFQRGAARVAVHGECELLPVIIRCSPPALLKNSRWYDVPSRAWRLSIKICPPRPITSFGYRPDLPCGVAARRVTQNLEHFFNQHLADYEQADRRPETTHHRLARP